MTVHHHRAIAGCRHGVGRLHRRGEGALRPQLEGAVAVGNPLAEHDRTDMPLAHGAQRHDEAHRAAHHARLVRVLHHAGVHQRGRRIRVFVAEIGPDQPPARGGKATGGKAEHRFDFAKALLEQQLGLPVALLEIVQDPFVLGGGVRFGQRQHIGHQPGRARAALGRALPAQMEGPEHDARGISMQTLVENAQG